MPIFIKDFTWSQTESILTIRIPLKNCQATKCNIFTSARYIKAHQDSYICEIFLDANIDEKLSSCTITNEGVEFRLSKVNAEIWSRLEADLAKEQRAEIRNAAITEAHDKAKEHMKQLTDQREKLAKAAIHEQMRMNEEERNLIEQNRQLIIDNAFKTIHEPKCKIEEIKLPRRFPPPKPKPKPEVVRELPPLRACGEIEVQFTPRKFPTPKRESTNPDEQEWLRKQADARKCAGFCPEDLRPEEMDPDWLKDKGDSFLRAGNYLGAEAAYSHAISLGCNLPAMFCNRAAAHLALGNLHKAVEDCSKGLELLTPLTTQNVTSRARCHVRRAAALCRLGTARLAIPDLEEALKLRPDDDKILEDLKTARKLAEEQ